MNKKTILGATAAMTLAGTLLAASASAYTWSDYVAGTGHVGKGEVQSVFNWNNQKVQTAWINSQIEFSVVEIETWSQDCVSRTKGTITNTYQRTRERQVADVGVDAQNNQITSGSQGDLSGFALIGWGDPIHDTTGWGTNPWAYDTNNGCPASTKPNGPPTRTVTDSPLKVIYTLNGRWAYLTYG